MSADLRQQVAEALRGLRVGPFGPTSLAVMENGGRVHLTPSEACEAADAVLAVVQPLLDPERPSSLIEALIERSSLGSEEAKAARASVSDDAGTALVLAARYLGERDRARSLAAQRAVELADVQQRVGALADQWQTWAMPHVLDVNAEGRSVAKATVRYVADLREALGGGR